jgi:hypothetical protein
MEKEIGKISVDQPKKMFIRQPIHPIAIKQTLGDNI